jgi:integrase
MSSLSPKDQNPQSSKLGVRVRADGVIETLDGQEVQIVEAGPADFHLATGRHARALHGDLAELRALRLKRAGGRVFKRGRSPFWQLRYLAGDGKWRDESSHTRDKRDAQALLNEKVFYASAGKLPGTGSFEQIVDALVLDASARGLQTRRLTSAARNLRARLEGYRAEDCDRAVWDKYVAERKCEAALDTLHLELKVAKRAYRLALEHGRVSRIPNFPSIENLHVRQGFLEPGEWAPVRARLSADFGDAAEFAYLAGPREMEVLGLTWADIELEAGIVNLRRTKTDRARKNDYSQWPEMAAVIERRAVVRERLKRAGVITPWVFCFGAPRGPRGRQHHAAGAPLFKMSGEPGLLGALRAEWDAACADAGLPGRLFHDLRRTAARNFERAGVPRSVARCGAAGAARFTNATRSGRNASWPRPGPR